MTRFGGWLARVRGRLRIRPSDQDLQDQIASHLEEATDEYLQQGLSPEEARRAARLSFGSVVQTEESFRDVRGRLFDDLAKDLRYAWRSLRRNPGFATVAVLSLALGIGANTAIFSVVNAILLRPRPVSHPERMVELYTGERGRPYETTSYPSYVEFRDRNEVLTGLAAYSLWQFKLTDANPVEQIWGEVVSGNYFDVIGVLPSKGRPLVPADDSSPGHAVAVISHELWQRRFNADPDVIGRAISINGQPLTVVGVAPGPYTGIIRGVSSELWIPITALPHLEPAKGHSRVTSRGNRWLIMLGRLRPDTTVAQAQSRFDRLSLEMQESYPEEWKSKQEESGAVRELFVSVLPERETRIHPGAQADVYALVAFLVAVVNVVLLMACMNLASMLLARAVVRRKEVAIRLALGASRRRLIRQLITESVVLALLAGLAGLVLTVWVLGLLLAWMPALPEGIRPALDLQLDWRVFAYTIGFSTITGALFGLVPALQSSKTDVSATLKDDSSAVTGGYRRSRSRMALVVLQVAFSLLLLIGAGLVLRSLDKVRPTRLGFSSDQVLVVPLNLDPVRYDRGQIQEFYRQVSERVAAQPGVQAVSLVEGMPGGFMSRTRRSTEIEGYAPGPEERLEIDAAYVGPRYFTHMQVPIVQGRDFDERDRDGAPCVAVVNEAFVKRYFAGTSQVLGKHLTKFGGTRAEKQACEVVGVVRDDRWQSLQKSTLPFYALAVLQSDRSRMSLLVHTADDPAGHIKAVRHTVQELDANMPITDVQTLAEYFRMASFPFQVLGVVMTACGVMALLLATVGIYGLVSYAAAQRTREVGIRMALGALRTDVLRMMVGQGMRLVAAGLALGLLLSVALTRVLASSVFDTGLLFGVSATDSLTFAGVTILLAAVAVVACYIPARRAARVDPIKALRYD